MVDPVATPIIVLAHGSPDPDWRRPIEQLCDRLRARSEGRIVRAAYMEHTSPSLVEAVAELASAGRTKIVVVAAFLSAGGNHLKRHIPELVSAAAEAVPGVELRLVPGALGTAPEVIEALATATERLTAETESMLGT